MNIIKSYGMTNEDVLSSYLIAIGGDYPIQVVNCGNGEWRLTGMGFTGMLLEPFTNREILDKIESSPTVLLKKSEASEDAYLIKGTLPAKEES